MIALGKVKGIGESRPKFSISFVLIYLKGRNFRGKKISRILAKFGISAKFAKINSFFDPENVDSLKLIPAKIFKEV